MKLFKNKTSNKHFEIKGARILEGAFAKMTHSEKFLTLFFVFLMLLSVLLLLGRVNAYLVVEVPESGGHIKEGVIGFPRFLNPLLESSNADRDLTMLVYSGLMKATPEGDLIHDLAESYVVSDDGLVYTFKIREDAVFHDGERVTADDVVFTISKTLDTIIKSPKRANWDGVFVEKLSELEVQFVLREPFVPFLENTTIGILPMHIWGNIEPEQFAFSSFNVEPVGSGPYKINNVNRDSSGIPEYYVLDSFDNYTLGQPYITTVEIHFYSNEEQLVNAYKRGDVTSINSISADIAEELKNDGKRIEQFPLPRIFGVFFNQNQAPVFTNKEVRKALNIAVDRDKIVEEILSGYGTAITGPIPRSVPNQNVLNPSVTVNIGTSTEERTLSNKEVAINILEDAGWELDGETGIRIKETSKSSEELSFIVATSNALELKRVAEILKREWGEIGANVEVQLFEIGNLNQDVIRPRKYDALLFGEIIGREMDLFAFWHSSQRNDPGLNIALYANITADSLLEEIRTESEKSIRIEKFERFEKEIQKDIPAVFLYSPDFIYVVPKNIKDLQLGTVTTPAERFLSIHDWYIKTDHVWQFFVK